MAGDEISLRTGPLPHFGQTSTSGSENFWIRSKRLLHASHWYSYMGMTFQSWWERNRRTALAASIPLFKHVTVLFAEHQRAVQPDGHGAVGEQCVVEPAE